MADWVWLHCKNSAYILARDVLVRYFLKCTENFTLLLSEPGHDFTELFCGHLLDARYE